MKKLLISILIILLIVLSVFIGLNGLKIGSIQILGIKGIQEKNAELDKKVQQATKLASTDYKKAVGEVQENAKKLTEEKNNYEEIALLNENNEGQATTQIQKYEIETLWVKLGNYATSEGATLKIDLMTGTAGIKDTYNLKFTVNGSYISITDFISDIENDTTLGFKIEEFKMTPSGGGENLQATFVCKDVTIIDVSNAVIEVPTTNTNNTTNSTNTTNTTNTANSTNTTNTNSAQ